MTRHISLLLAFCLMAGCSTFSPDKRQPSPIDMPSAYTAEAAGNASLCRWWEHFGNNELNSLVETALTDNLDIREAWARLHAAQAVAAKSGAALLPSVNLDSGYTHKNSYTQSAPDTDHTFATADSTTLGVAASYELDLWGKIRSEQTAARLSLAASRMDVDAAATSIAASIADAWVELQATRQGIRILEGQIETNQMLVSLQELRFANSMATALDVMQQRETLAGTEAELPLLRARESVLANQLAVLTGTAPGTLKLSSTEMPRLIELPKTGLPADILAARPDVRAAWHRLIAADWDVSVAKADRMPSLNISARAAFESAHYDVLFSNWLTSIGAGLTGPIFDAGARKAEVERRNALANEKVAAYGKVILTAIQEVEDGLTNEHHQQEYIARLRDKLAIAKQARSEARLRYLNGQSNYLPFLTENLSVQALERNLVTEEAKLIKYRIGLYRALGGDWMTSLTDKNNDVRG